ncbi:MAG: YtxH domain-containing protein [Cryobacterium sp.]|nr:YtxH domain-containing protein [Cryobacterium sp.]
MRNKIILLFGLGVGYVLGARAGRGRYEQIKRGWLSFWNSPGVQTQVQAAEDFVKEKAPEVVDFVSDTAKKFVSRDAKPKSTARTPAAKSSSAKAGAVAKKTTTRGSSSSSGAKS